MRNLASRAAARKLARRHWPADSWPVDAVFVLSDRPMLHEKRRLDPPPLERQGDAVHGARLTAFQEERRPQIADLEERRHDDSAAGMASSGSTRGAGGGANSPASSGAFASTPS